MIDKIETQNGNIKVEYRENGWKRSATVVGSDLENVDAEEVVQNHNLDVPPEQS